MAWKHLLDVYPPGLTGCERLSYMSGKTQEYHRLRDTWTRHLHSGEQVGWGLCWHLQPRVGGVGLVLAPAAKSGWERLRGCIIQYT